MGRAKQKLRHPTGSILMSYLNLMERANFCFPSTFWCFAFLVNLICGQASGGQSGRKKLKFKERLSGGFDA